MLQLMQLVRKIDGHYKFNQRFLHYIYHTNGLIVTIKYMLILTVKLSKNTNKVK